MDKLPPSSTVVFNAPTGLVRVLAGSPVQHLYGTCPRSGGQPGTTPLWDLSAFWRAARCNTPMGLVSVLAEITCNTPMGFVHVLVNSPVNISMGLVSVLAEITCNTPMGFLSVLAENTVHILMGFVRVLANSPVQRPYGICPRSGQQPGTTSLLGLSAFRPTARYNTSTGLVRVLADSPVQHLYGTCPRSRPQPGTTRPLSMWYKTRFHIKVQRPASIPDGWEGRCNVSRITSMYSA
jgi:hypothetical protein